MTAEYLFVYGTLRKIAASRSHQLLAACGSYLFEGSIQAKLYDLGAYPGVIESSNADHRVYGEVYTLVDDKALAQLDDYEGCSERFAEPHEYIRKKLPARSPDGAIVLAWVYVFNGDASNLKCIESGCYPVHNAGPKSG